MRLLPSPLRGSGPFGKRLTGDCLWCNPLFCNQPTIKKFHLGYIRSIFQNFFNFFFFTLCTDDPRCSSPTLAQRRYVAPFVLKYAFYQKFILFFSRSLLWREGRSPLFCNHPTIKKFHPDYTISIFQNFFKFFLPFDSRPCKRGTGKRIRAK